MTGIVFFRSADRDRVVTFYRDRLGFENWLEQDAGCTSLRRENLVLGFCEADTADTEATVTIAVPDRSAVDALYVELTDIADHPQEQNESFDIYQFFGTDPKGRTIEIQTVLHPTPDTLRSVGVSGPSSGSGRRRQRPLVRQFVPVVRGLELKIGAGGDDACRRHVGMGGVVVLFDMLHVHRPGDAGQLVQLTQIRPEVVVLVDVLSVAHEVSTVHL